MTEIIHNVTDRRNGFICAWAVEPLDYNRLTSADVGRTVIYRDMPGRAEAGTLSSWRNGIVFVRYHKGDTAAGTNPSDLAFGLRTLSPSEIRARAETGGNPDG